MKPLNKNLHNPNLEGDAFLWKGGPVGVMLAHGLTATAAEVRPLAKRLHEQGYTVAGPLLAGHGTTPEELNRTLWIEWVQSGESCYKQLTACCEQVFVGGESTGALVALYLASRYPEIAGILTYAPAIKLPLSSFDHIKFRLASLFITAVPKNNIDAGGVWQGYPVNPLKAGLQLLQLQKAIIHRLPQIKQPIFIAQGHLDTTIHPESGQIIYDSIGSTVKELHWLEKSSHVVIIDVELDKVTDLTLAFLEKQTL